METSLNNAVCEEGISPPPACEEGRSRVSQEDVANAFERLRQRANGGDARAREVLKKYLDAHPELWAAFGDTARHAELALIEAASGGEWLTGEAIQREAARMRSELAGPSPTPLEKMAVERIVVTWLQLQHTETRFLQSQKDLGWAKYWLRRLELAEKLHRAAIGSLVVIRDLLPAAAPASTPAIADAPARAPQSDADDIGEPSIPAEFFACGGPGANRIAHLIAYPNDMQRTAADDQENAKVKTNGYHHRLDDLLAHRS